MHKVYILTLLICVFSHLNLMAQVPLADMLEKAMSAVITIAVYETDAAKKTLGFRGAPTDIAYSKVLDLSNASGSGSGFVIEREGKKYIITNAHVIEQASDRSGSIAVYSITRDKYETRVVGGDSFYDLAVLEFVTQPGKELSAISFRENDIRVGEQVFAIGNPLGEYPYSVSEGIISAKNRVRGGLTGKFGFLQSTATVIWGNSGGPLIDGNGKVVGINSQIAFASMGNTPVWQPQINFALEAGLTQRLIKDILENGGLIQRSYLGFSVSQEVPAVSPGSHYYRLAMEEIGASEGPSITGMVKGSPAEKAFSGKSGYSIIGVNNVETRNVEELLGELEKTRPGQSITFKIRKGASSQDITLQSTSLNASRANEMASFLASENGWSLKQDGNQVIFTLAGKTDAKAQGSGDNFRLSPAGTENNQGIGHELPGEWTVVAAGILDEDVDNLWRVEQIADIATAARLSALSGIVDLILFKKGSNPTDESNYLKRRLDFSKRPYILRKTLLY